MEKRVSVVVCYNSSEQIRQFEADLQNQSEKVNLLAIDNTGGKYPSCSSAYNAAVQQIQTEFVIFSHQDIRFCHPDTIRRFVDDCEKAGENDIVGVVGKKRGYPYGIGNIYQGTRGHRAAVGVIHGMTECDTVDECFFGGRTACFRRYPFSETLCDGWHCYAVERCLAALARHDRVLVADSDLIHLSGGRTNHAYNITLYKICMAYRRTIDYIATTCESTSTRPVKREAALIKRELHVLKRNFLERISHRG